MNFRGIYEHGMIRPTEPVDLPNGSEVEFRLKGTDSVSNIDPTEFWKNKTIYDFAREQGVGPVTDVSQLVGDWPPDDDIDEFLRTLREIRH